MGNCLSGESSGESKKATEYQQVPPKVSPATPSTGGPGTHRRDDKRWDVHGNETGSRLAPWTPHSSNRCALGGVILETD